VAGNRPGGELPLDQYNEVRLECSRFSDPTIDSSWGDLPLNLIAPDASESVWRAIRFRWKPPRFKRRDSPHMPVHLRFEQECWPGDPTNWWNDIGGEPIPETCPLMKATAKGAWHDGSGSAALPALKKKRYGFCSHSILGWII